MKMSRDWAVFWILVLIVVAVIVVVYLRIVALTPPYILPTYASADVTRICDIFQLSAQDDFCANPQTQNANSLENMLYRNYPRWDTHYSEIYPFIERFETEVAPFIGRLSVYDNADGFVTRYGASKPPESGPIPVQSQ